MLSETLATLDLNQRQNRVPLPSELGGLRSVRERNLRMTANLERELLEAKLAHDRIEIRYQDHLRELEGIKSELSTSIRFIDLLEKQRGALQEENGRLDGILHPIRRCPEDILRLIFESTPRSISGAQFTTSTILSQVCRAWRKVALQTPLLWTRFQISIKRNDMDIRSFMERTHARLYKASPIITLLFDVRVLSQESATAFLEACNLQRFESIKSLLVQFSSSNLASFITLPAFRYSTGPLNLLKVMCGQRENFHPSLDFSQLLQSFPTAGQFIFCKTRISSATEGTPSALRCLKFENVVFTKFHDAVSPFSNLEELIIGSGSFSANEIRLPNVTRLVVTDNANMSWSAMVTPRLQQFKVANPGGNAIAFACRHATIEDLCMHPIDDAGFLTVAASLTNLRRLQTGRLLKFLFDWASFNLQDAPFCKLTSYIISDLQPGEKISLAELENLIRTRGLAQTQNASPGRQLLEKVCIGAPNMDVLDQPWQTSTLLTGFRSESRYNQGKEMLRLLWTN